MRNLKTATDVLQHRLETARLFAQAWADVNFDTRAPYKELSTQCMYRNQEGHWNLVIEIIDAPKNTQSKDTIFNIDILGFEKIPEVIKDRAAYWENRAKDIEETMRDLETTLKKCDQIIDKFTSLLDEAGGNRETRSLIYKYTEEKILNLEFY